MLHATSILEEHLQKHDIAGLMAKSAALRGELWGPLCRIVLAVRDARDVEGHEIKWNELPLGDVRAPVTLDDLRAFLTTGTERRPYQAVQKLASLFDVLDMDPPLPAVPHPQTVTLAELITLASEVAPVYLPALLPSPHFHVRQRLFDLHVLAGEALGVGQALAKTSLDALIAGQLKHGTLEAIGAYLRDGTEHLHPQDLTELGARLPVEPPAWITEAYARACLVAIERAKTFRSYELTIQTHALTAPQIEACLIAARRKSALFSLVAAQVAIQGRPEGAAALAAIVGDKKFGAEAARWLAAMGAVGRAAAAARPPSAGAEEKRIKPLLAAIAALPDAPSVFAGYQLQMPRFGLDVSRFLIKTPAAGDVRVASTPLEDLEKALNAPLVQEALAASGWADALQIISLDNRLAAIPFAHARALGAGLLGRGADEASLVAALDRLDWCANVTRQWGGNKAHLGHILLWAGASERVFLHAVARFHLLPGTKTVGTYDEKFGNALDALKPSWAPEVKALLTFLEFEKRQRPPFLGPPPVVASMPEDAPCGPSAELAGAFGDLWVFGEARGATKIEVTARGSATLEIDVPAQRWKVSGLRRKGGDGTTIPLRDGAVEFALEMHKDRVIVGVGGALVASTFEGLPPKPGPVRVRCAGVGAEVTRLVAYEKHAVTLADHASGLLDKPDNVEAIEEVRALESRGAAFTLAIVASLSGKAGAPALEALQGMSDVAADFRAALGIEKAAPGPRFVRRSFAEVCKSFAALSPKKKLRRGEVYGREAVSFGDPESPRPRRGEAVGSPTLYLSTDGMIHSPSDLLDTIAGLPALTKGWGRSARVSAAVSPDEYLLAALEIAAHDDEDALFYECVGAIWAVEEGHVIAVWDTDRKGLAQVMGMKTLPTELEWNDLDDEMMLGE